MCSGHLNNDELAKYPRTLWGLIVVALWVCLAIVFLAAACGGCRAPKPGATVAAVQDVVIEAEKVQPPLVRAETRREQMQGWVRSGDLVKQPTLYAKLFDESLGAQQVDLQEASHAGQQTIVASAKAEAKAVAADTRYETLAARWYVKWGIRVERVYNTGKWLIGIAAVLFVAGGIAKDTGLAATGWGAVLVVVYRVILAVLTCFAYPFILLGRWLVAKKFPVSAKAALTRTGAVK